MNIAELVANGFAASLISMESIDFTDLTDTISAIVPLVVPVVVSVGGIRKALSFLSEAIRGC